uniref:GLOBIN domain-containing protein n=1 Tax=Heterorhabditis bacteriophora TaxID=37862 RepID=A0A1I7XQX7_HETBA
MTVGLSQEVVSIGVIALVCVSLSIFCLLVWLFRCRRDQLRHKEEKGDRQKDINSFQEYSMFYRKKQGTPFSKRRVGDKTKEPKKAGSIEDDKKIERTDSKKEKKLSTKDARPDETMGQYENRMRGYNAAPQLERIKEENSPKRFETISNMTTSEETLQRNDSKKTLEEFMDSEILHPQLLSEFISAVRIHNELYDGEASSKEVEKAWTTVAGLFDITEAMLQWEELVRLHRYMHIGLPDSAFKVLPRPEDIRWQDASREVALFLSQFIKNEMNFLLKDQIA